MLCILQLHTMYIYFSSMNVISLYINIISFYYIYINPYLIFLPYVNALYCVFVLFAYYPSGIMIISVIVLRNVVKIGASPFYLVLPRESYPPYFLSLF